MLEDLPYYSTIVVTVKAGTQEGNNAQDVGINKQEVHL